MPLGDFLDAIVLVSTTPNEAAVDECPRENRTPPIHAMQTIPVGLPLHFNSLAFFPLILQRP